MGQLRFSTTLLVRSPTFYTHLFYASSYFFLSKLLNPWDRGSAHNVFLPNVTNFTEDGLLCD